MGGYSPLKTAIIAVAVLLGLAICWTGIFLVTKAYEEQNSIRWEACFEENSAAECAAALL